MAYQQKQGWTSEVSPPQAQAEESLAPAASAPDLAFEMQDSAGNGAVQEWLSQTPATEEGWLPGGEIGHEFGGAAGGKEPRAPETETGDYRG